jgi:hypothetical protein
MTKKELEEKVNRLEFEIHVLQDQIRRMNQSPVFPPLNPHPPIYPNDPYDDLDNPRYPWPRRDIIWCSATT